MEISFFNFIFLTYPKLSKRSLKERDLGHPTPVSVGQYTGGAVPTPHPSPLCKDLLEFRSGPASDQSPYQG